MIIPIELPLCILCKNEKPGDLEHIIPEMLGGKLQSNILCNRCNQLLGSSIVSKLKDDPTLFYAVEILREDIPEIFKSFEKQRLFEAEGKDGITINLFKKGDEFHVKPSRKGDVLNIDSHDVNNYLKKTISRRKLKENVDEFIELYKNLSEDEILYLPDGSYLQKEPIGKIRKKVPTNLISDRFWGLVAFEFLTLFAGVRILNSGFDPIREFIINNVPSDLLQINHFQGGKKYQAIHVLILEPLGNDVQITIRLFRWITTQVIIKRVHWGGQEVHYLEDLKSKKSAVAISKEDVLNHRWRVFD